MPLTLVNTTSRSQKNASFRAREGACAPRSWILKSLFQNRFVPESGVVKDPSTSLRISPSGSDAARTAQDVLFRVVSERDFR